MPETIYFFDEAAEYGYCSNFATAPILLKGKLWPTTEHYYQAQKYAGSTREEDVRLAHSPMVAKNLTRLPEPAVRADWDQVKVAVMYVAVRAKFQQYPHLAELLLSTGNATLVEHTEKDRFWGDGGDGSGQNWLGRVLMDVRAEIRAAQAKSA
jgi:hypothetical protein